MGGSGLVPHFPEARLLPAEDALALDGPPLEARRAPQDRRPHPAAYRQFRRSRPARRRAAVDLVRVRPGEALPAMPISSSCRAPRRPSPALPRSVKRASISTSPRIFAAAAWCSGSAAIRCSAAPSTIRAGSKATRKRWPRPARCRDHAIGGEAARTGERRDGGRLPFSGYEMHMGATEGPDCRRPFAYRRWRRRGCSLGRWPRDRHLYPRAVCRRPPTLGVASALRGGGRGDHPDALIEATLDRLGAHLAANVAIDRLLKLAR